MMLLQAYAVGADSSEHIAACQEVKSQMQSPEGTSIPVCLVCDTVSDGSSASDQDYHQFGFGEINLQVMLLRPCCVLLQLCYCRPIVFACTR